MARDALIVGINRYHHLENLRLPATDADAIAQHLVPPRGEFRVRRLPERIGDDHHLIVDPAAPVTTTQLEEAIVQLFKPDGHPRPDVALLFVAGHGLQKKRGTIDGYLATSDTDREANWGVSLRWLRELLRLSPVPNRIVWLDTCHSGGLLDFREADPGTGNRCLIAASRAFEAAYEELGGRHGVLAGALLQGLDPTAQPDGRVTTYTLAVSVDRALRTETQQPLCDNAGEPILLTSAPVPTTPAGERRDRCPYKGLRYFDRDGEDPQDFFGRRTLTDLLIDRIRTENFLAVLGVSGSGKSSVVRAGLLHQLQLGERIGGSDRWPQVIMLPGNEPLDSLAAALMAASGADKGEVLGLAREATPEGLAAIARHLAGAAGRLVLLVDQGEELFTQAPDTARPAFLACMLGALDLAPEQFCLVLTLRADFYAKCADQEYSGLARRIQDHLVTVLPMTPAELREAIVQPAQGVGLPIEEALVAELLAELKDQPGHLPLLQDTLTELWHQDHASGRLTLDAYRRLGGLQGTLARRADALFEAPRNPHHLWSCEQDAARWILVELTRLGEGTEDTRRRVVQERLVTPRFGAELVAGTLAKLADARLVVTSSLQPRGADAAGMPAGIATVEVAHEALIRHWPRLRRWLDADREFQTWRRRLHTEAKEWKARRREVMTGAELAVAEDRGPGVEDLLDEDSRAFLRASIAQRDAERRQREERKAREEEIRTERERLLEEQARLANEAAAAKSRRLRSTRRSLASVVVLLLGALLAVAAAVYQTGVVTDAREGEKSARLRANDHLAKAYDAYAFRSLGGIAGLTGAVDSTSMQRAWLFGLSARALELPPETPVALGSETARRLARPREGGLAFQQRWFSHGMGPSPGGEVSSVAFSPNGQRLACGSEDGSVRLWDPEHGTPLATLEGHGGPVRSVAFSPDGQRLVSGSEDGTVRLWDAEGGTPLATLEGHNGPVQGVAFSPDGQRLVSGSEDGTVRLWDPERGTRTVALEGHDRDLQSLALSPDGRRLAAGSGDGAVRLWDAQTGELINTLEGHRQPVHSMAFSPDGQRLAYGSEDGTVSLWDAERRTPLTTLEFEGIGEVVRSVVFSLDGQRLASVHKDGIVLLWDIHSGKPLTVLGEDDEPVGSVAFSPDGRRLASGLEDGTVQLWDTGSRRRKPLATLESYSRDVRSVAFSPDGGRLAGGSEDGKVRVWDTRTGQLLATSKGHPGNVYSVAFSPDGQRLASGSMDGIVRLWDAQSSASITTLAGHTGPVWSVAFSPDGKRLVSGSEDGTVRLWDAERNGPLATIEGHAGPVWSVAFSPDGQHLASGSEDGTVRLWDPEQGTPLTTLEGHGGPVRSVAFSPDGRRLASGGDGNMVRLWDTQSGQLLTSLEGRDLPGGGGFRRFPWVNGVVFSSDGHRLATGSTDGTVRLWDAQRGTPLAILAGYGGPVWVWSVAFSSDGKRLASGDARGAVQLWDARSGAPTAILAGHDGAVWSVAFSPDRHLLATGSTDGTARVWDAHSGALLTTFGAPGQNAGSYVEGVAFSPDGRLLVSTCSHHTRLWDVRSGEVLGTLEHYLEHDILDRIVFSSDWRRLAAVVVGEGTVLVDSQSGEPYATLADLNFFVDSLVFSPDGRLLASSSRDVPGSKVRLWDAQGGKLLATLEGHNGRVRGVAFSPDGRRLAGGSGDGTVQLWDVQSAALLATLEGHEGHGGGISSVAFSPDGRHLASGSQDETVRLWNTSDGALLATVEGHRGTVKSVAFSPDGRRLASGSDDRTVRIWEVAGMLETWGRYEKTQALLLDSKRPPEFFRVMREGLEFLWELEVEGLEVKSKLRLPALRPEPGHLHTEGARLRPLLDPPPPNQGKLEQVIDWTEKQLVGKD